MSQNESENELCPCVLGNYCPEHTQSITVSKKESDWEKEFDEKFGVTSDKQELPPKTWEYYGDVKHFISKTVSNREKEIAEEVKKLGGYSNFKEEVLKILNHNQ